MSIRFWVNASWSVKTLSKSSARSNISLRMKCEKFRVHLALPRIMRRISGDDAVSILLQYSLDYELTRIMCIALADFVILKEECK